jgi:hypothetical protein
MHALVVAAVLLSCDGDFRFAEKPALERAETQKPPKGARRFAFDGVTIYASTSVEERLRAITFLVRKGNGWWRIEDYEQVTSADQPLALHVEEHKPGLLFLSYTADWLGANRFGHNRYTIVLDTRSTPRIVRVVECSYGSGGGACTGPEAEYLPQTTLACETDLRCTSTQRMPLGWAVRKAQRTFDLVTDQTIPREEATYRVTKDITARHGRTSALMVRFYAGSREIPTTRLTNEHYSAEDYHQFDDDHSTVGGPLEITTRETGDGAYEVTVREGKGKALFLVSTRNALRVGVDAPEHRTCGEVVYPPSIWSEVAPAAKP